MQHLPKCIAVIDATPPGAATNSIGYILDDFMDAFAFYARRGATDAQSIPRLTRIAGPDMNEYPCAKTGYDALVFAHPVPKQAAGPALQPDDATTRLFEQALHRLCPNGRVYAIAALESRRTDDAEAFFAAWAALCAHANRAWCGGLAVPEAHKRARWAKAPRMGWRRRKLSEAIDRLILAVRTGSPF